MIGCLPTQALEFLAVFVYATHATHAIAFEWKPGLTHVTVVGASNHITNTTEHAPALFPTQLIRYLFTPKVARY